MKKFFRCQNRNFDTPPNPPVMKNFLLKSSKKIKGKTKSGEKMRNQVTFLPEIAETLYQSGQKAGNLIKIQVTGSYLKLPAKKR
jgi:hypothetical protein